MATQDGWAQPPMARKQMVLFAPSLDDMIPDNHEVRLLDEVLRTCDWTEWCDGYKLGGPGQPRIHPRVLAGIWLYAMMRRIRTSRPLEYACSHNIDFMWLAEGFRPDHTTLATFFSKNTQPIKDLFKQVCRIAMTLGLLKLGEVGFDGTRVKAANSRYRTLTAESLEQRLAAIDQQISEIIQSTQTAIEDAASTGSGGGTDLPDDLGSLEGRRKKLHDALAEAQTRDAERREQGKSKTPAQVPMTDPDSHVLPNKEGGFAPNYTPTAMTDESGIVLDASVLPNSDEAGEALATVDRVTELCEQAPRNFLADGGMASGAVLAGLEERNVTAVVPVKSSQPSSDNPALRDDLSEPVAREQWDSLPKNGQGRLDKSCFVYDEQNDAYHCPGGRELPFESREKRQGEFRNRYRSLNCDGCPLAALCLAPKDGQPASGTDGRVRGITRDAHATLRERTASRMLEPDYQSMFHRRSSIAETPFGWLKGVLGLRQFRHVGLEKVEAEWIWSCLTLNLKKVLSALQSQRIAAASCH